MYVLQVLKLGSVDLLGGRLTLQAKSLLSVSGGDVWQNM